MPTDQKKRLLFLGGLFIIFGLLAAWVSLGKKQHGSFAKENFTIAIQDTASIQKISIQKPNGSMLTIAQPSNHNSWVINSSYKARIQLVNYLKFGLSHLEVKRPVAKGEIAKVTDLLKKSGLKCSIISQEQTKEFSIMTNPNDLNSSYYLEKDHTEPLIVYVPGVKGDLSNLLNLGANDWRAREIFSSTARTLLKLQVRYKERKEDGFEIAYKDETFGISDLSNIDTLKLKKYISIFNYINADRFESMDSLPAGLRNRIPDVVINLEDLDSTRNNLLRIYFLKELNKMVGLSDKSKEAMVLNPQVFKFVLINKKYFIAKKSTGL